MAALDGGEVVTIDRRGTGSDRASRPLSVVTLISGYTMFRCHIWRYHLQQIELRGDLEQRAAIFWMTWRS